VWKGLERPGAGRFFCCPVKQKARYIIAAPFSAGAKSIASSYIVEAIVLAVVVVVHVYTETHTVDDVVVFVVVVVLYGPFVPSFSFPSLCV
jgi:hypothetical protein